MHEMMLKAAGVTSKKRSSSPPDVPTIAESGMPRLRGVRLEGRKRSLGDAEGARGIRRVHA